MPLQTPVIMHQWYSRVASVIVATVIVIESAIVLFYDQICDCEFNKRKKVMLKMVTIFTTVNSLQEYSGKYTPMQFSIIF